MVATWVLVGSGLTALVALVTAMQYNRMVGLRNRIQESWSDVDTELRRRHDLVPNLVATVQGYATHEANVLGALTRARAAVAASAARTPQQAAAESALGSALDRVVAVAEGYPELKASANFLALQSELTLTEDRIQAARRFYNANVRDYRNQVRQFPGVLLAGLVGMRDDVACFEVASPQERQAPAVASLSGAP